MQIWNVSRVVPARNTIEVGEDSWRERSNGSLITKEGQSCGIIAVHSSTTKTGYLAHLSPILIANKPAFRSFFDVLKEQETGSELEVWLGGMALINDKSVSKKAQKAHNEELVYDRSRVVDCLQNLDANLKVYPQWSEDNFVVTAAQLDCSAAILDYSVELRKLER